MKSDLATLRALCGVLFLLIFIPASHTPLHAVPAGLFLSHDTVQENRPAGSAVGSFYAPVENPIFTFAPGDGDEDNDLFSIDGNVLKTAAVLDRDLQSSVSIRMRVTDADGTAIEKVFVLAVTEREPLPWPPGSLDPGFNAGGVSDVRAIARQGDGKWIIGGGFTSVDGVSRGRISRLNSDGSVDHSFMDGMAGANGTVSAVAIQSNGKILIGGSFTAVNGEPRGRIARLHPDGTLDETFGHGLAGLDGYAYSIVPQEDGTMIVGGLFTSVNGADRKGVARLNADGTLDTSFGNGLADRGGDSGSVISLAVQSDDKVVIGGGSFEESGAPPLRLARLNEDGTLDNTFLNDLPGPDNTVLTIAIQSDGEILIGGWFTEVNGAMRNRIARLHPDGAIDHTFGHGMSGAYSVATTGTNYLPVVDDVAIQGNGKIIIGGAFNRVNGWTRNNIARLNGDGSLDQEFGHGLAGTSHPVRVVSLDEIESTILIGGAFTSVNNISRQGIARVHASERPQSEPPTDVLLSDDSILERLPPGATVGTLFAVDPDADNTHAFTLSDGEGDESNALFTIDGDTLKTAVTLDYDAANIHSVRVKAIDSDGLFVMKNFVITVESNDAPSDILLSNNAVPENRDAGLMVGTFSAVDPDEADYHVFELVAGDGDDNNDWFTLEDDTLKTAVELDQEAQGEYTIRIRATDRGQLFLEKIFSITVGPDSPPSGIVVSSEFVPENQPIGTAVRTLSSAGPYPNDPLTFTLVEGEGSEGNAFFAIDGDLLRTAIVFDREDQESYSIRVHGTNAGGYSVEGVLHLTIVEASPAITDVSLSNATVGKQWPIGSQVGTFQVIDPTPNQTHTFTLLPGEGDSGNSSFAIDGNTVITGAAFDHDTQSSYTIRVRATNSEGLFIRKNLTILVSQAGGVELTFDSGSINWPVYAVARQDDGKWIIGGTFTSVQGTSRGRLARLNSDGSIDSSFLDGLSGAANDILAIAIQDDGKILIGGRFITINGKTRFRIARLHTDGSLDLSFVKDFEGAEGAAKTVRAIAVQEDGKVLIGGDFEAVNGEPRNGIARFNEDGALDEDFVPSLSYLNRDTWSVASITVQPDGKILVAGSSQKTSGEAGPSLVRLRASGSLERSFDITGRIESVVLQDDSHILIGGSFTSVLGQPRNRIARLDWNGTLDSSFGDGQEGVAGGRAPLVHSIALQSSGKILIGGSFSSVNGEPRNNIARLNSDGNLDRTFGDGMTGANSTVHVVAPMGQNVLLAGTFWMVNGVSRERIAVLEGGDSLLLTNDKISENRRIGTTIGKFSAFDPALGSPHAFTLVDGNGDDGNASFSIEENRLQTAALIDREEQDTYTIRVRATGIDGLFVERAFTLNVASSPSGIAPGEVDHSFKATPDSEVYSATRQADDRYIITGLFSTVQGIHSPSIARLNADGSFDHSFQYPFPGTIARGVNAVVLEADNKIFIGGGFSTVHGEARSRIARLNPDGDLDTTYGHDVGDIDRPVRTIAVQPDGNVLIGGDFTNVHGATRGRIARLNPSGALDTSFGEGLAGANDTVRAIWVQQDGKILIGGPFTAVNGLPRNHIARLNSDGTLDDTFAPGLTGADGRVSAILVQPDERIVLGGWFTTLHGQPRNGIARLHPDGSIDHSFAPATGEDDVVNSLALQNDGMFLLGGSLTVFEGRRTGVARLHSDGLLDASFDAETRASVSTVLSQDDGKIFIAGWFSTVNGIPRSRLARLQGGTAPPFNMLLADNVVRDHQPIGTRVGTFSAMDPSHHETHDYSFVPGEGDDDNDLFTLADGALETAVILDSEIHKDTSIRVRASNSLGLWVKESFTISVIPDLYLGWAESLPDGEREPTDDPGAHRIPNLLRYAFGMDPLQPEREKLPQVGRLEMPEEGQSLKVFSESEQPSVYLTLTYARRTDDDSLAYIVEASDDLIDWLPLGDVEEVIAGDDEEIEIVTVRDSQPIDEQTARFLRLRVER